MKSISLTAFSILVLLSGMASAKIQLLNMQGKPTNPDICRKVKIKYVTYDTGNSVAVEVADSITGKTLRPNCDIIVFSGDDKAFGAALTSSLGKTLYFYSYSLQEPYGIGSITLGE
ncbi:MAG: hypothetical protein ACXWRE_11775 [Pseudobdellovibrionaceae bacterium]